ncbi:hypothetical protein [Parasedimentitalea psychrophila]|uniref:DNA alkylation repair protein n=1 Tax=Parasedimentitalea psychrophila TaxID=2997337 RepID=A0A9Y2L108_9RHOB|nr:hypothetical protein [Parasedimentitalea psychrophila]WIY25417.1 hypothetical protein QPJ95_00225 [Parasedimentitalea psychrophila]
MATGFSLKDQLFNGEKVRYLAGLFALSDAAFDSADFEARVMARLPELELKQRIFWIAEVLGEMLPAALPELAELLLRALPEPLDPDKTDDDFGDFIFAPLGELVVTRGLDAHPELALDVLAELTQRFSMEFAVRPLLNRWPELVLARMQQWALHDSYHVRRLASEGTRPRLPWGLAVELQLQNPLPLLDVLHGDPTRFVTRSVANHLNDITKKDPELVLDRLDIWRHLDRQERRELDWITAHALRGLIKAGHPRAMRMLGYDPDVAVEVRVELQADTVRIGEVLEFTCHLKAAQELPVLVDYRLHFLRPSGRVSVKVFKLKQARLGAKGLTLSKRHPLKGNASTFTLVPGAHHLEVMVNGRVRDEVRFEVLA